VLLLSNRDGCPAFPGFSHSVCPSLHRYSYNNNEKSKEEEDVRKVEEEKKERYLQNCILRRAGSIARTRRSRP
jgi:hypothetical protein